MDWIGLGMGWDLCVGLLYEHRFAMLKISHHGSFGFFFVFFLEDPPYFLCFIGSLFVFVQVLY